MTTISASEYRALAKAGKPAKYLNKRVKVEGISFDSQAEAKRYGELKYLLRGAEIDALRIHPAYELHNRIGVVVGSYVADFSYWCKRRGCEVVEDVKSPATMKNKLYQWKKRHFESEYRTRITEIEA